jgi:hypothetical protein
MMYLEAEISSLGAMSSSNPALVNGVQELDSGTAAGIMAFLKDKYFIPDALQPQTPGVSNFTAVPGEVVVSQGYQLEGQQTADQQLMAMPAGQVAVANLDDVKAVALGQSLNGFHVTTSDAATAAGYAKAGSNFAVLWPLGGVAAGAEKKKSMVKPLVGAVIGGGAGALVGGGVGAVVGAVGGYLVGNAIA